MKTIIPVTLMLALIGSAMTMSGCELTQDEIAATTARRIAYEQRREEERLQGLAERVANFQTKSSETIAALNAMTERHVADIDAATSAITRFRNIGLSINFIESMVEEGEVAVPEAAVVAKNELRRVLVRKQRQLFPAMRRTYAAHLSQAVYGTGANFRAVGSGNRTLRAASASFNSPSIVVQAHDNIRVQATQFRFTRAEYVYALSGARHQYVVYGEADDHVGL